MGGRMTKTPKRGDLIEIFRVGYQHWAVYVGRGKVVHVTAPPGGKVSSNISAPGAVSNTSMSVPTEKAMVRKEKLKVVVGNNKWTINNSLDEMYEPRPASTIVKEALRQVDKRMEYSVFSKNCEHFATKLRYGKAESQQAQNGEEAAISTVLYGGALAGLVFEGYVNNSQTDEDEDSKTDLDFVSTGPHK